MQILLYIFSALMMLAGLYGLVMGWDIIMVERGWSQFIAGATAFSSGVIVLAITYAARQLKKLRSDIAGLVVEVDEPAAPAVPVTPVPTSETVAAPSDAPQDIKPGEERAVVGTYASGGVTYFMYGDHSIEAELQDGRYRFSSMEELRTFLDTGVGGTIVRKGRLEE
jgi:hypothetical protein